MAEPAPSSSASASASVPTGETNGASAAPVRRLRLKSQYRPVASSTALARSSSAALSSSIPSHILTNPALQSRLATLPSNYNFEIPKTLARIESLNCKRVALQFPEGLLLFAPLISDILTEFGQLDEIFILGDVSYGACCVDDLTSAALDAQLLVHYGHSCLVSVEHCKIPVLYVFVEIAIDVKHFLSTVRANFSRDRRVFLAGTVQFSSAIQSAAAELREYFTSITIPQAKPLSKGEVLGCTAPNLLDIPTTTDAAAATDPSSSSPVGPIDTVLFLSDGRFHLESLMIQNPQIQEIYKYDPYSLKLTREKYDHDMMKRTRFEAISNAKGAKKFGVILGTLGRQGNLLIVNRIEALLGARGIPYVMLMLSEIFPAKLAMFEDVEAWIQVACPRLSIDWGFAFSAPLLSPYEAEVALDQTKWREVYPMDFYSDAGGEWTNYYVRNQERMREKQLRAAAAAGKGKGDNGKEKIKKKIEIQYDQEEDTSASTQQSNGGNSNSLSSATTSI